MRHQPVILVIFDGWGIRSEPTGNAIIEANPLHYLKILQEYPWITMDASGEAVGLPHGQMGNSEVGHLNMGAGRIVYQELTRIDKDIRHGDFFKNEVLLRAMRSALNNQSTLHIMGLLSDGGVHSSLNHLLALLDMAKDWDVKKVRVHAFLDGRDVPPQSAEKYLDIVEKKLVYLDYSQIATITGRYYAMDRDKRWERIEKAYKNLVMATGRRFIFSQDALQYAYNHEETDEFVSPSVCDLDFKGISDGDSIIFFNFRPDRARQLTKAFTDSKFDGFARKKVIENLAFACMGLYDETLDLPVAFPKQSLDCILAEVLSKNNVRQFRTAETEKYAHVTYFFNGGFETPYSGEDRKMVPSPKVATYDMQPEMSLPRVCQEVVNALNSGKYDFIATNFANPDMVGHTGKMDAAIKAVQVVDTCLGRVMEAALSQNWILLLTSDHGNIEMMLDENGEPHTAHTTNPVPLVIVSNRSDIALDNRQSYPISCIAPTILNLMGIQVPSEMTTKSPLL